MKKKLYGTLSAILLGTLSLYAESEKSVYDTVWGYGTFIDKEEGAIQKLALSGRLQGDAYSFDGEDRSNDDLTWRRFRFGFVTDFFNDFTIQAEMDLDLNEADSGDWNEFYNRLTDSYLAWSPSKQAKLKLGKQSAGFTLDGATSSKRLLVPERSVVGENIWFPTEYFTGAQLSGTIEAFKYKAGAFSASGEPEFGHFDSGWFTLLSAGMTIGEDADLRLDYIYNNPDFNGKYEPGTRDHEHVLALVYKNMFSEKLGFWSDVALTKGISGTGQSDLFGMDLMPFYNFSDKLQLVFQYANVISLDDQPDVAMSRYAYRNTGKTKVSETHNFLLGFNWFLYAHKLKWQNAIEYNFGRDLAATGQDYHGYGVTSALRIYW